MELLAQGAMVERFARKKCDVKVQLNSLVDDLFAFMLSEVTALVPPLPSIMSTAGGATITMIQTPSTTLSREPSLPAQPQVSSKAYLHHKKATLQQEMSLIKEEEDGSLDDDISSDDPPSPSQEISPSPSSQYDLAHQATHHPNGYCDSDCECYQCYECMDESMVKVEMNEEGGTVGLGDEEADHFERQQRRKRPKTKRNGSNSINAGDGPSQLQDGAEGEDEEDGENVANNHQIETIGLKCWYPDCHTMLEDRAKLNQHLFFEHDKTLPYHCRVVGCGRQFDVRKDFWTHIRESHSDYTCSICSIKFNGYFPFITHEFQLHEEGIFKCSREDCDFVAPIRDLVYKHTKTEHVKFVCNFEGCGQSFECYSYLKRHRRIHSQVKPYRCKYPNCGYSSTQCGAVIQHIRIRHFKLPSSVKKQKELNIIDHRNPNDYLEILTDLLN